MHLHLGIFIHREKERERERGKGVVEFGARPELLYHCAHDDCTAVEKQQPLCFYYICVFLIRV